MKEVSCNVIFTEIQIKAQIIGCFVEIKSTDIAKYVNAVKHQSTEMRGKNHDGRRVI